MTTHNNHILDILNSSNSKVLRAMLIFLSIRRYDTKNLLHKQMAHHIPCFLKRYGWKVQMNHCQSWVNRNWQQADDHIVLQTEIPNCMWIHQSWKSIAFSGIQIYKPLPHARLQLQYQTHWKENKINLWRENSRRRKWKAKLHNIYLARGTSPKFGNVIDLRGVKNGLQKQMTYILTLKFNQRKIQHLLTQIYQSVRHR